MRESNFSNPQQNRASCVVSTSFFDRKALDTRDPVALINSLTNLQYLTSVSQKVRDIVALDGGIERLVRIMKWAMSILLVPGASASPTPFLLPADRGSQPLQGVYDRQILYIWTLAFQCCVNIGVRGSEELRTKVVQAGVLDVAGAILGTWKASMDRYRLKKIKEYHLHTISLRGALILFYYIHHSLQTPAWLNDQHNRKASKSTQPTNRSVTPESSLLADDEQINGLNEVPQVSPMPPAVPNSTPNFTEQNNDQVEPSTSAQTEASVSRSSSVVQSEDDAEEQQPETSSYVRARSGTVVPSSQSQQLQSNPQLTPANTPQAPVIQQQTPQQPQLTQPVQSPNSSPITRRPIEHIEYFRPEENTIYREEDVLLALQLLAYISKYPHIREGFQAPSRAWQVGRPSFDPEENPMDRLAYRDYYKRNLFYVVESFTYEGHIDDPTSIYLPSEIRYWAGVTMRNACRKHESFNGIRQCANVACGKWESSPKEFAKCRICRKAKYCSKECQSRAWRVGHRFWCVESRPSNSTNNVRCQTRSDMANESENFVPTYLARDDNQQTPIIRPEPQAPAQQIPQPGSPLATINQINRDFDNWTNVNQEPDTTANIFEDEFTRRFTGIEQTPNPQNHFQLPPLRFNDDVGVGNATLATAEQTPSPPQQPVSPGLTASISEGAEERERRHQTQDYLPRTRSALSEFLQRIMKCKWFHSSARRCILDEQTQFIAREWLKKLQKFKIPEESVDFTFSRSSGKGGQNVNKTSSKATARMQVKQNWLPKYVHNALREDAHYVKSSDSVVVSDSSTRSAAQNSRIASHRLESIITIASEKGVINETSPGKAQRVDNFKRKEKANMEKMKKYQKEKKALRRNRNE
ncbi:hypothetical protein E3Q09_03069 [Wallemia mellicola]|nr:hypothetical protein E3Q09_03069 [Wallemia mellicola]